MILCFYFSIQNEAITSLLFNWTKSESLGSLMSSVLLLLSSGAIISTILEVKPAIIVWGKVMGAEKIFGEWDCCLVYSEYLNK